MRSGTAGLIQAAAVGADLDESVGLGNPTPALTALAQSFTILLPCLGMTVSMIYPSVK